MKVGRIEATSEEEFLTCYNSFITRPGKEEFLEWLWRTDFFTAPASTKFHGAKEGGLVTHSLNVFQRLVKMATQEDKLRGRTISTYDMETLAICGLLHDICKIDTYIQKVEVIQKEDGTVEPKTYYSHSNNNPQGHGEKSVILILQHGLAILPEEITAINWHMGGFDSRAKGGSYDLSNAFNESDLAVMLHLADMQATYFDEKEKQIPVIPPLGKGSMNSKEIFVGGEQGQELISNTCEGK
jgi:HD superfamily phosphohydrolase YqeK